MPKTKDDILNDLSEKQLAELHAIDERLNTALLDRRAGRDINTDAPARMDAQIGSITFRFETVRCGKENCSPPPCREAPGQESAPDRQHRRAARRSLHGATI